MTFKPLPILTICSVLVLGLLLWLGQWQWQRAGWKAELISEFHQQESRGIRDLDTALCADNDESVRSRVQSSNAVSPEWLRVFGQSTDGRPGWRIFTAIEQPDCIEGAILAESAFEDYNGKIELIDTFRIAPVSENKTAFSNENSPETNEWYWFDLEAMEDSLFVTKPNFLNTDIVLLASNGLPADLTQTPPSKHIGYSLTWYGMAIALFVLYLAFHIRAGRLSFGKKDS
ncbi:SURF1 family cytochrome oxidase biogenesis protein [Hirschia baltica]|uniref:SURF1-like protein n=1 Tax=Hirschia baltica (strain ATCC 49814 / DSM 5838 / IFAM 1418) TaxID=582402 RepID=C6XR92_HIRBI|nr:SURF1 family cytochrome oxidase biogenesis protein [Hirschia baltica]ACT58724.1 conserved hypothetical protein [Hirschia baltica ATCC 49814]